MARRDSLRPLLSPRKSKDTLALRHLRRRWRKQQQPTTLSRWRKSKRSLSRNQSRLKRLKRRRRKRSDSVMITLFKL